MTFPPSSTRYSFSMFLQYFLNSDSRATILQRIATISFEGKVPSATLAYSYSRKSNSYCALIYSKSFRSNISLILRSFLYFFSPFSKCFLVVYVCQLCAFLSSMSYNNRNLILFQQIIFASDYFRSNLFCILLNYGREPVSYFKDWLFVVLSHQNNEAVDKIINIFICQIRLMSRFSPYSRGNPYKKQHSPLATHYDNTPHYNERQRNSKQSSQHGFSKYRNQNEEPNYGYRPTQKKKYDNNSYSIDDLVDKNNSLAVQNTQLYQMLEERGRIVTALEKKLQDQMYREVQTLEEIELEKNKFINDSHRKFKEYEVKIQELIREIYVLNEQRYQENMIKAHEIDLIKESFSKQQTLKMHQLAMHQLNAREQTENEQNKAKVLLELKNNQMEEITFQYKKCIENLKKQIGELNSEIVHLNHIRKIETSQQKIMFDHILENMAKDHAKQKELISIEHDLLVKKLDQLLTAKEVETGKLGELVRVGQIEQSVREQELLEKKDKLEVQIRDLQEFYRKRTFDETQRLKWLNNNQISALSLGNKTSVENLKEQIASLMSLTGAKTDEITKLYSQLANQRQHSSQTIKSLQQLLEDTKQKMKDMQKDQAVELQQLKIKWADLTQADLAALKEYHQRQLELLQEQLRQKTKLADNNREKLHHELQDKNQMRKRHDLQILKLNTRISQLELMVNQLMMNKKEEATSLSTAMNLTSTKLLRAATEKEKINSSNEEEKRKLQEIIVAKDKEIEELNQKLRILRENYTRQIAEKNAQLQIIKKHKQDLQIELKKEKYFYQGQMKKRDSILKNTKEEYEAQIAVIKKKFKEEYDTIVNELTTKITHLESELNKLISLEKKLKNEIFVLKQSQQVELGDKAEQINIQKGRHEQEKKSIQDKLKRYYQQEIRKLEEELAEVKKQLAYKEEDLRELNGQYHRLQQKMQHVLESQNKLRHIQQSIINLGLDNNIIKNFAEVVKKPIQ